MKLWAYKIKIMTVWDQIELSKNQLVWSPWSCHRRSFSSRCRLAHNDCQPKRIWRKGIHERSKMVAVRGLSWSASKRRSPAARLTTLQWCCLASRTLETHHPECQMDAFRPQGGWYSIFKPKQKGFSKVLVMLAALAFGHFLMTAALKLLDYHYLCLWHVSN